MTDAARIAEIHNRLGAMLSEEEALFDELERLGDTTYEVTDESVERTRTVIQIVVENARLRDQVVALTEKMEAVRLALTPAAVVEKEGT